MKITGDNTIAAPVDKVWDALLDPRVLVATLPGCERLEQTGEHAYDMTVRVGVAAIRGTYTGTCRLGDLKPGDSLTMRLRGAGAPGTIDATVGVRFEDRGGQTRLFYDADAVVGGMLGGVGQRMLSSVSRRMAGEFFGNVERVIAGEPAAVGLDTPSLVPRDGYSTSESAAGRVASASERIETSGVFTRPTRPAVTADRSFLTGLAVGGALALAGVVLGGIIGRRGAR